MKKIFYLMIMALMPVCFSACGSDDDSDSNGMDAEIVGNWRIQSVVWSHYIKGGSIEQGGKAKEYDPTETRGITITQVGGKYSIVSTASGIDGNYEQVGTNEFRGGDEDDLNQRLVIVGVNGNILTVEFYEDYYKNIDGKRDEYGLLTFVRQ